jgi:hypothetical protein
VEPASSIQRLGFARWYERRLIEGHAWFVSGVLCLVAIAACVEEAGQRAGLPHLIAYATLAFVALALGLYCVLRYGSILGEAESLGERATCPGCGAYARFAMATSHKASCRRCGNEWRLID